VDEVGLGQVFS